MNDARAEATVETRPRSRTILACLFVLAAGACARPHPGASPGGAAPVAPASEPARAPSRDAATEGEIEALLREGRAELAQGRADRAEQIFEAAAALDGGSPRTRVWVIRSWLPQGRINDALDAADALEREGAKGPALDYLYGMAFSAKARDYQAKDVSNQISAMSFADATAFLERATAADPELYADAFAPLAEAAWSMQKLELAGAAAARARALDPGSAELALLAGRIALAAHAAAAADPARAAAADASWEEARADFARALELSLESNEPARRALAAQAANQLGHTFAFRARIAEAAAAYAQALGLDPRAVDLRQIRGTLGDESFLATLEAGSSAFTARHGTSSADDAALCWWLGWARLRAKQHAPAETALLAALAKNPSYANSWWFVALARYGREDWAGAVAALRSHWEANAADLASSIAEDLEANVAIVRYLIGWCLREHANVEGGMLSETLGALEPKNADHWNNAGLFWRSHGERLQKSEDPVQRAKAPKAFERAFQQYARALELEPENPGFLNDLGVMLHYHLDRELERAAALYAKATENALAKLADPALPEDRREWYQNALRDSRDNQVKLRELLEKRRAEPAPATPGAADQGGARN